MTHSCDVLVIGGGVIGLCAAIELAVRGYETTIVEPRRPGLGTAAGSAGYLSESEIFPMARPSVIAEIPRMLLERAGPVVIRPQYLLRMPDWGWRFLRACNPATIAESTSALASLNGVANATLLDLARRADAERYLVFDGALHVSRTRHALEHAAALLPVLHEHGISGRLVDAQALREREPALTPGYAGALEFPNSGRCTDLEAFGSALALHFARTGGRTTRDAVASVRPQGGGWYLQGKTAAYAARTVIVAAGVWTKPLLEQLGYHVPLVAQRGYHLMLPEPGVMPKRTLLFEEAHFCATPMDGGLRLAGTAEFADPSDPPDYRRADILFEIASRALVGLRRAGATRWMGSRPSFPDSRPAIGSAARHDGLFYAFGHERLGLTQAAITARCVTALVAGEAPPVNLKPFALERFS